MLDEQLNRIGVIRHHARQLVNGVNVIHRIVGTNHFAEVAAVAANQPVVLEALIGEEDGESQHRDVQRIEVVSTLMQRVVVDNAAPGVVIDAVNQLFTLAAPLRR